MIMSLWSIIVPAVSHLCDWPALIFLIAKLMIAFVTKGTFSLVGVPTLVVSALLRWQSRMLISLVSLISIVSFVIYHKLSIASIYSLLWVIPLGISIFAFESLFARIVAVVLVGHAVGTMLYMVGYIKPDAYWVMLLPIAAIERLLMAAAIFSVLRIADSVKAAKNHIKITNYMHRVRLPRLWSNI